MYLSFQVSVHHSGGEDGFTASEIHPWRGGLHSEYKYMNVPRPGPLLTSQQLLIMNWPAERETGR